MARENGTMYCCHPIFAISVSDYPEQCLVTPTINGECPTGTTPHDKLGDFHPKRKCPPRDLQAIQDALDLWPEDQNGFYDACKALRIKPIAEPFWRHLPYVNIYLSITPDILHQLYQGVIKHLVAWIRESFGDNEIDARCRRMPLNYGTRIFSSGISPLSRVTGKEHREICQILLGLVIDLPLPSGYSSTRLVTSVRAILDFLYLAQLPVHSASTLKALEGSLKRFHDAKQIFIDIDICNHFNLPKIHRLMHYPDDITLFGTTDNYNTESTERLHIDMAKDAYRATNHCDEYPQMVAWLERREKIQRHAKFIQSRLVMVSQHNTTTTQVSQPVISSLPLCLFPTTAKHPSAKSVSQDDLTDNYGATRFGNALSEFIVRFNYPGLSTAGVYRYAQDISLPFFFPVFHYLKFRNSYGEIQDSIYAKPNYKNKNMKEIPGRFDTVLVKVDSNYSYGVQGLFYDLVLFSFIESI
jgi:hypothetical protein